LKVRIDIETGGVNSYNGDTKGTTGSNGEPLEIEEEGRGVIDQEGRDIPTQVFPSLSLPLKENGKAEHTPREPHHKAWAICTCGGCDIISGEGRKLLGSAVDAEERVCVCPIHSHTKAAKKEGRRRFITYISNTGDTGAIRRLRSGTRQGNNSPSPFFLLY
jgi:hypothetical protein